MGIHTMFPQSKPKHDMIRLQFEQIEAHSAALPGLPSHLLAQFTTPPCSLKNRYRLILPLSDHRVRLLDTASAASDYINANYVDGKRYIATQAPVPRAFADFWQMVVEQGVEVIVMLVRVQPRKAEQYWPDTMQTILIGGRFEVTVVECMTADEGVEGLCKRRMTVHDRLTNTIHAVTHYQYTEWPDHGPPQSFPHFHQLHQQVLPDLLGTTRPVVVHCSAGVGRTGCFITIDHFYRLLITPPSDDALASDAVCQFVMECRRHRPWFVETVEQYVFVHEYFWWLRDK